MADEASYISWDDLDPQFVLDQLEDAIDTSSDTELDLNTKPYYNGWYYAPVALVLLIIRDKGLQVQHPSKRAVQLNKIFNQKLSHVGAKIILKPTLTSIKHNRTDSKLFLFQMLPSVLDDIDVELLDV